MKLSKANYNITLIKINMAIELDWRKSIEITLVKTPLMRGRKNGGDLKKY